MLLYIVDPVAADALCGVDIQQLVDEISRLGRHVGRYLVNPAEYLLVQLAVIVFINVEGALASQKLVYEAAKVPKINRFIVGKLLQNLRSEVLGRAADGLIVLFAD